MEGGVSLKGEFEIRDFTKGYMDGIDDNLLPDNASRDCQNVISRIIGSLENRPGQERLNDTALPGPILGLYAYYLNDSRELIAASGGGAYKWDIDKFSGINAGLNSQAEVEFETCVNYMVAFNGVDTPWKYDGATISTLANAPIGRLPILHKEKLFIVPNESPSSLWWSDDSQPESWPAVNYSDIRKGDGDIITCLRKQLGELVIFKRRSIHSLRGTSLADFRLDEIEGRMGCVGPRAAINDGNLIYFISDEGLCMYNGMRAVNLSQNFIPKLWEGINKEYLHKAVAGVWDGLVWFAVPEGESAYNNLVIICDPENQSFWPWRGINVSCFQQFNDGYKLDLFSGSPVNGYVNRQGVGTDDFGTPITAYWEGKAFDKGSAEREKKAKKAFVTHGPATENIVDLQLSLDYGPYQTLEVRMQEDLIREYKFQQDRWRYLSPKFVHNKLGGFEVRGLLIPYKVKDKPKVRG